MKTSQLIKLLQKIDPNDECIVCIDNHPVKDIDRQPYYYDGRLEYIERDRQYNPIKVGYKAGGDKIKVFYDTLEDALMDNPDAELELSAITYQGAVSQRHLDYINDCIKEGKEFQDWKQESEEAHKNKTQDPVISPPSKTIREKMSKWFKHIGLLK